MTTPQYVTFASKIQKYADTLDMFHACCYMFY